MLVCSEGPDASSGRSGMIIVTPSDTPAKLSRGAMGAERLGARTLVCFSARCGMAVTNLKGLGTIGRRSGLKSALLQWGLRRYFAFAFLALAVDAHAQPFRLPTANRSIFERGQEEKFFVGTTGKPWTSGTFGCVRTDGWQMHEGLDIRCLQRDQNGEPIDPVLATADGAVAYINARPSLSNYGNYIVLRHQIEGLEIYSLYR